MVLPIGDAPNPRGVPVVTWLLIAANVMVYVWIALPLGAVRPAPDDPLLREYLREVSVAVGDRVSPAALARQVTVYDLFVYAYGFRPAAPALGDLFVSLFLHAGLLHLAGNMLFLWIYGDNVERRLGAVPYLAAYLASGVVATLAHWAGAPGSVLPVVGASGAISGVLGFYFVWFPRNVVRLLWLIPPFLGQVFQVPARVVLGFYLIADNLLPYLLASGEGGVAHGAHIGGFVAGVALAWASDRRRPAYAPEVAAREHPAALVDGGRLAEAAAAYFALPAAATRGVLDAEQGLALAGWLRRAGHADAALVVLRRLVRDTRAEADLARAHLTLGLVLLQDLDQPTPAYQHFLSVLDLEADADTTRVAREALAAIAARQKRALGWRPR